MKKYTVISVSEYWFKKRLIRKVEKVINDATKDEFEIISVSFANWGFIPMAYITVYK